MGRAPDADLGCGEEVGVLVEDDCEGAGEEGFFEGGGVGEDVCSVVVVVVVGFVGVVVVF